MDNGKTGKLIAKLRKEKGFTQQQLGDEVGVGYRSVSKWECGRTFPDKGIINHLSDILGITARELLAGEIDKKEDVINEQIINSESNEDQNIVSEIVDNQTSDNQISETVVAEKKKIPLGIKILIGIILSVIMVIVFVSIYFNNKTYVYNMVTKAEDEYFVEGHVNFKGDEIFIVINLLMFMDNEFNSLKIKNYEYEIFADNNFLFGYGYIEQGNVFEEIITVENFTDNFRVNFSDKTDIKRKDMLENNILIICKFLDNDNNEIIKEIEILLYPQNEEK